MAAAQDPVRIDRWLWAARLMKTRQLASEAVQGGRVEVGGRSVKPSRMVKPGDRVDVSMGQGLRISVDVLATAEKRGPAKEAALLYEETEASRKARERLSEQLRSTHVAFAYEEGKPTKRDRRELERFRDRNR